MALEKQKEMNLKLQYEKLEHNKFVVSNNSFINFRYRLKCHHCYLLISDSMDIKNVSEFYICCDMTFWNRAKIIYVKNPTVIL